MLSVWYSCTINDLVTETPWSLSIQEGRGHAGRNCPLIQYVPPTERLTSKCVQNISWDDRSWSGLTKQSHRRVLAGFYAHTIQEPMSSAQIQLVSRVPARVSVLNRERAGESERDRTGVCVCVCVWERVRKDRRGTQDRWERETGQVCVCEREDMRERETGQVCVCVCEREWERTGEGHRTGVERGHERERQDRCVCVWESEKGQEKDTGQVCVCVSVCVWECVVRGHERETGQV